MSYKAKARVRGRDIGVIRPRLGLGLGYMSYKAKARVRARIYGL